MANNLATQPWVIDTPGAATLYVTDVEVEHFEFVAYTAQGSDVQVQDRFGKVVWEGKGAADLQEVRSGKIGRIHGLAVPILQNQGILRVYIR